jgi:citrate synthase
VRGPSVLLHFEDHWPTEMGAWFPGQRVVLRGKDMFRDLAGLPWIGLLLYGITGRLFDEKQLRLFEGLWVLSSSYPEPRLWNNRVAGLAGTARSTGALGVSAAIAVSEATIYGRQVDIRAIDFLLRIKRQLDSGADLAVLVETELRTHRGIPGYGRPFTRLDERIEPVMRMARGLGFADGPHVRLAFAVEDILLTGRWRLHMNVAALAAALSADQGLTAREYYHCSLLCFAAGTMPCLIDAQTRPEGALFPLRCSRIEYQGPPPRTWD